MKTPRALRGLQSATNFYSVGKHFIFKPSCLKSEPFQLLNRIKTHLAVWDPSDYVTGHRRIYPGCFPK